MLYLIDFINSHSDWEEVLQNDPYNVKISRDNGYIMFMYNQLSSDFTNPVVKECRGIILEESTKRVVCHAFDKFMNAEESTSDIDKIDWNSASVQRKIDGSIIKVWFDNNAWHISTNGTIDAFKALLSSDIDFKSFGELFTNELQYCGVIKSFDDLCKYLSKDETTIFELVTDYNRVVVPPENYDGSIYLLGARNNITNQERDVLGTSLSQIMLTPERYNLSSYDEVRNAANALPWDEEGYVVCDKYFHRVKIKSPEYVKAHYLANNGAITKKRLFEIIRSNEESEFLAYVPQYTNKLNGLKEKFNEFVSYIQSEVDAVKSLNFESRKDFAMYVKTRPAWIQGYLFKADRFSVIDMISEVPIDKLIEHMVAGGFIDA